jgi:hypothetical protein
MSTAALVALLTLVVPTNIVSQVRVVRYGDDRLAGINEVDMVVSLTADSSCPIAPDTLETLAAAVLRQAGLKATTSRKASSWFHSVLIDIRTVSAGGVCASAVTTELVAQVEAVPEADRSLPPGRWGSWLVGSMSLLRFTDLVTSSREEHDAAVWQSIQSRLVTIAGRLRAANP